MIKDFAEREGKIKPGGGEDFEPNSFGEINMFVKTEVFDVHE